ncbi:MAG: hypothetical protein LIO46_03940 [Clostridiales bacterium]|nr:hypothetical protein [Clostridiales bacterium]
MLRTALPVSEPIRPGEAKPPPGASFQRASHPPDIQTAVQRTAELKQKRFKSKIEPEENALERLQTKTFHDMIKILGEMPSLYKSITVAIKKTWRKSQKV